MRSASTQPRSDLSKFRTEALKWATMAQNGIFCWIEPLAFEPTDHRVSFLRPSSTVRASKVPICSELRALERRASVSLRAVLYCSKKRKEEGRERRYKSNVVSSAAVMYEVLSAEKYYTKILERTWSDLTWKSGGYRQRDTPLRGERPQAERSC